MLISKDTFSPVMAKGVLNHCSNVATDLKMVGRRKLSRAHSSGRLFCVVTRSERKLNKLHNMRTWKHYSRSDMSTHHKVHYKIAGGLCAVR